MSAVWSWFMAPAGSDLPLYLHTKVARWLNLEQKNGAPGAGKDRTTCGNK